MFSYRPVHGFPRVNPVSDHLDRETVKWSKPEKGWAKINFDGASIGNPGISRAGYVACDDEGKILCKGARRLQDGIDSEAEVQTTLLAVALASNMKVLKLHLEGNSQIVVQLWLKGILCVGN